MGGTVPLGYDVVNKKLVVHEAEAETVRALFTKFNELRSVTRTLDWARQQNLRTKLRMRQSATVGGAPIHYGALRCILSNRTYIGEVEHKGETYPGQQQAIIRPAAFEEGQQTLATISGQEMRKPKLVSGSLLQGIISDRHGRRMGPVHTTRNGQRLRYYVPHPKHRKKDDHPPYRTASRRAGATLLRDAERALAG